MTTVLGWILGIATVLGGLSAVFYFRDKWWPGDALTATQKRRYSERLGELLVEAQQLRARLNEGTLSVADHNAWVERANEFLRSNLGRAYEARFSDFSGMTFYGDSSERSRMSRSLEGRCRRLHEFMAELRE